MENQYPSHANHPIFINSTSASITPFPFFLIKTGFLATNLLTCQASAASPRAPGAWRSSLRERGRRSPAWRSAAGEYLPKHLTPSLFVENIQFFLMFTYVHSPTNGFTNQPAANIPFLDQWDSFMLQPCSSALLKASLASSPKANCRCRAELRWVRNFSNFWPRKALPHQAQCLRHKMSGATNPPSNWASFRWDVKPSELRGKNGHHQNLWNQPSYYKIYCQNISLKPPTRVCQAFKEQIPKQRKETIRRKSQLLQLPKKLSPPF